MGARTNIICKAKEELDWEESKRKLNRWMRSDISKLAGEIHYGQIKPRIICEEYLDDLSGDLPIDYKIYCFGGKAFCTLVCTERGSGNMRFAFYDKEWKRRLPYFRSSLLTDRKIR